MYIGQDELHAVVDVNWDCAVSSSLADCFGMLTDNTVLDSMATVVALDASQVVFIDDC